MGQLIWIAFLGGLFLAIYFGGTIGRIVFLCAVVIAVAVFRRPLVLALTHLNSSLGLTRSTIDKMPSAIHLTPASGPADAARPLFSALASCGFVDAGAWDIVELPQIKVSLMVQPEEGMFAAVESAPPIGAHVNIHTLYPDGRLFTVTNSELPAAKVMRPNVARAQFPRCTPADLVKQARAARPPSGFRPILANEAVRVYEELYAEEIRFRKEKGM